MVAAIAAFTVGIDLRMANLHQATAACMQQMAVSDHPCTHVMIDHHLNDVARTARCAKKRLGHRPGADIVLNIHRHAGMVLKRFAQRHLFDIFVKWHAMNDTVFSINNAG